VLHCQGLRELPFLKQGVLGVVLVRNTVVPVIDPAGVLGHGREKQSVDPDEEVVVLRYEGNLCGIPARHVRVLRGSDSRIPVKIEDGSGSFLCREGLTVEGKTYAIMEVGSLFSHLGL
jgi:chemotaxis signal transduction protein